MVYIGIDIAKRSHMALALTTDRNIIWSDLSIHNNRDGFETLLQHVVDLEDDILVGVEATSIYWLALYAFLIEQEIAVVVFNPLQIHAYRKSGIRKRKDDRIDAFWIADYMRVGHTQMPPQFEPHLLQLRELTRFRAGLTDQLGRIKRQIIGVLDRIFPEYETLFSSIFIQTSRRLLSEALSPVEFADYDLSELADVLQRSSRGRFGSAKAAEIKATAERSIGVTFLVDALSVQMRCLLGQLDLLETQRTEVDDEIAAFMTQIEQFITTIPGIGPVTGATIMAEIGSVERFASPTKLVAYAGIDPSVYQSGQFNARHTRMSKRGSPYLRHALWLAAVSAVRHDPQLKAYYERRLAQGKHRNVILGAVCRQLLNRIFVILKEQRPYEIRS